ncbi:TrkH family potassium uptake protein [Meridianimarinicoccus aquatilis]|uniref:TrkH family potassium uptake protein n=1 Tax=Meridianimarinicoccus aquatilis TaxID=2552766 RepID=A0A4R6B251_9RHOB|nr:potassium transporter TrkG [Fluviibacterium aquatile]TDL91241.1 TrkH family potassium uptake protein [Fluviibacterium aquatile]
MTISDPAQKPPRRRASSRHRAQWYDRVPLMVLTTAIGAGLMIVPAIYAGLNGEHDAGRPFLYGAIVFTVLSFLVGLSVATRPVSKTARGHLMSLLITYLALPVMLAAPLYEAIPDLSFSNAWFEMVSSLTTTGATVFSQPARVPDTIHLWRALVGWYGGFMIWVAAIAILAPVRVGGFELVLASVHVGGAVSRGQTAQSDFPMRRILRFSRGLAPIYGGLTLAVWLMLLIAGEDPFVGACHAMSALASSGISPLVSLQESSASHWGEAVLLVAMVFALSRATFANDMPTPIGRRWWQDPEIRIAATLLIAVPTLIFVHHWVSLYDVGGGTPDPLRSLWGSLFMTMSFLTTNGFISAEWEIARNWSGITTPGLILLGLAMVGGGVATTAGGVKLLRVYVLYRHGRFESARLVHPRLTASPGHRARRFKVEAAYSAWLSFMLFALVFTFIMLALSLTGLTFETNMILTTAALTNAGPLTAVAGLSPIVMGDLGAAAQIILGVAMVLGRLETLAIIALLNPEFWRA